jgi:hypothetical protein
MGSVVLEKELEKYQAEKERLLSTAEGKFVLIQGDEVIDIFDSFTDAAKVGYGRFGNVPFLIKQVAAVESPANFVSNLLAV